MLNFSVLCSFRVPKLVNSFRQQVNFCTLPVVSRVKRKVFDRSVKFQPVRYSSEEWDFDVEKVLKDDNFAEFSDRMFRLPQHGHNVLVIQPFIRNHFMSEKENSPPKVCGNTTPKLQLEEAEALINTLPRWKVEASLMLGVDSFNKSTFFGSGQIERIKEGLNQSKTISAVFVSVNILRVRQIIELETILQVPVFDRYTIVIQIFRQHAVTNESKLQIAMAEIPYLRQCIKGFPRGLSDRLASGRFVGGGGGTLTETRRDLLMQREQKLKKALSLLRDHRERLRNNPKSASYPVVAVMGYTNAGKTSLIKALTGTVKLKPRNQLFATLDVTKHKGALPCNLKVLYVDTVGFITDIPTDLLESFTATLEDAIYSDVIIHVWDVSNPDCQKQRDHVIKTLSNMNSGVDLQKKMFVVGNKVDRISENELSELQKAESNIFFVSTKTGYGMEEMLSNLQKEIIKITGRIRMKIRVRTGGIEFDWICKELTVEEMQQDGDSNYTLMSVIITKPQLETFKTRFVGKQ